MMKGNDFESENTSFMADYCTLEDIMNNLHVERMSEYLIYSR